MALPLYDHEAQQIQDTVRKVQSKYYGRSNTLENLYSLEREIVGKLQDLGFNSIVDITPCFDGQPIEVRVESRIDKNHDFDHDLKRYEVKKSREAGGR